MPTKTSSRAVASQFDHIESPTMPTATATHYTMPKPDDFGAARVARRRWLLLVGFVAFALLTLGARFGMAWAWPLPQCWLRKLTGLPCPACGSTRSLAAWSQWDLGQALQLNP